MSRTKALTIFLLLLITLAFVNSAMAARGQVKLGDSEGIRRDYHGETGKLSFIGANPDSPIEIPGAMVQGLGPTSRSNEILAVYGPEFGLSNPSQELQLVSGQSQDNGRTSTRYQQMHQRIPIFAGEIIVNQDSRGRMLSMSGEVSPDLSISTEPALTSREAHDLALGVISKQYGLDSSELSASTPELWIFDERLLRPSARPVELVWRMEVSGVDRLAIRELVLINAHTGGLSLHFNQVDTLTSASTPTFAPISCGDVTEIPQVECDALVELYNSANGPGWSNNTDWLVTLTPCSWYGITCSAGSVTLINLANNQLIGTLNAELGNLTNLQGLDLGYNQISGSIPASLGNLQELQNLGLYYNDLTGSIPPELGNLGSLTSLNIRTNYISGSIPQEIGLLSSLIALDIRQNQLTGAIPSELGNLVQLSVLRISENALTGEVPTEITSLTNLALPNQDLGYNALTAYDPGVNSFLTTIDPDWADTQTVPPEGVFAVDWDSSSVTLSWSIIPYTNDGGYYEISYSATPGGPYTVHGTTPDKSSNSYTVDGLISGTPYYLVVRTYTPSHGTRQTGTPPPIWQQNNILSEYSQEISAEPGSATPTPTITPTSTITPSPTITITPSPTATPSIQTYSANNGTTLPGSFLCDQSQPNCTGGSDLHADAAHAYAIDSYDFYLSRHGRYSLDSAGMTIISSVHYDSGYSNAFWDGSQVVYGDAVGNPLADDVVAHELTHGVTQYTSGLFYYYQSGAINESFSDLWGEFVDQTNGAGTDTAGVKWLIGEDLVGEGAFRDMEDPPTFDDPDKMTSPNYYTGSADLFWGTGDDGGVHTNSGVNNKAVYLMTDGGSFNGYTVSGLGIDKVAAIYYEVQINLLTSGADYRDLYYALYQGCLNLIPGTQGIATVDCLQVRYATEAVEMNLEPSADYNPDVEICPGGGQPIDLFMDDLESGGSNWVTGVVSGSNAWFIGSFYATSPESSIWGDDSYASSDSFVAMISDTALPAGSQPYLHFNHAFGFEDPDYDGGWLEYSTNGGSTWIDAAPLLEDGLSYTGTINAANGDGDNTHTGRSAFVGDSHGYVSNRYDLSSLAGGNVRFRWRISTDSLFYDWGWSVDDVRIYTCGSPAPTPVFTDVPSDYWARDYIEILYDEGYIAGCQSSPPMYCPHRVLNRAESAVFVMRGAYGAIPDPPYPPPSTPSFDDVDPAYWGYGWIESMWTDGFTAGCGTDPLIYCPLRDHTRAEGSVFFLRIKNGVAYNPPPPVGIFADVSIGAWYDGWVEAAYSEGLLPPCQTDPLRFCPEDTLDRSWAAYMMVWAKGGYGLPVPMLVPTSTATPNPP